MMGHKDRIKDWQDSEYLPGYRLYASKPSRRRNQHASKVRLNRTGRRTSKKVVEDG